MHNLDGTNVVVSYRVLSCSGTARSYSLKGENTQEVTIRKEGGEGCSTVIRSRCLTVRLLQFHQRETGMRL